MSVRPPVPYTGESLRTVTLCEETAQQAVDGRCPIHGGDACLYVYRNSNERAPGVGGLWWCPTCAVGFDHQQEMKDHASYTHSDGSGDPR